MSSSFTEITAFITSENTSPQSKEREKEKSSRNTVIPKSCTSPVAKDESVSDEQAGFALHLSSAPASRIQNEFDAFPCSDTPAIKSDSSASAQPIANKQTNCLPQPASANQPCQPNSDCTNEVAMRSPALESPARTQLLTRLSALTNESVDSLHLNTILNSALDRYRNRVNDALEYFQQAIATWKNRPGIGLFIHAVKSGQKASLTKPGCDWKEWADEAVKRRLMEYSHSHNGDILVHFVGGASKLWSQLRSLSWSEVELIASGGQTV